MNYSKDTNNTTPRGIIFTDFDGTLFNRERFITESNFEALRQAREDGYITAIATGRSLFSFRRVAAKIDPPIEEYLDYLIFSSGAGVIRATRTIRGFDNEIKSGELIEAEGLEPATAFDAAGLFFRRGIDFMIHNAVPENHHFTHIKSNGSANPDYYQRIKIYSDFSSPLMSGDNDSELDRIEKVCMNGVSQLVGVVPPAGNKNETKYTTDLIEYLRHRLSECSVVRTTSPLDHTSLWVEVFNSGVSKSKAAARLTKSIGLEPSDALAVGNDFNDEDLLQWAGTGRTVDEAPEAMRREHPSAGPAIDGAVSAAITDFIQARD